jgi:hypothetical protein
LGDSRELGELAVRPGGKGSTSPIVLSQPQVVLFLLDKDLIRDGAVGMDGAYEITLGPAAIRTMLELRDPGSRRNLANALKAELMNGPNSRVEFRFDPDGGEAYADRTRPGGIIYTATPLSFNGYTALHRPMKAGELRRLRNEQGRAVAVSGFYVVDILPAESAFSHGLRSAVRPPAQRPSSEP